MVRFPVIKWSLNTSVGVSERTSAPQKCCTVHRFSVRLILKRRLSDSWSIINQPHLKFFFPPRLGVHSLRVHYGACSFPVNSKFQCGEVVAESLAFLRGLLKSQRLHCSSDPFYLIPACSPRLFPCGAFHLRSPHFSARTTCVTSHLLSPALPPHSCSCCFAILHVVDLVTCADTLPSVYLLSLI